MGVKEEEEGEEDDDEDDDDAEGTSASLRLDEHGRMYVLTSSHAMVTFHPLLGHSTFTPA